MDRDQHNPHHQDSDIPIISITTRASPRTAQRVIGKTEPGSLEPDASCVCAYPLCSSSSSAATASNASSSDTLSLHATGVNPLPTLEEMMRHRSFSYSCMALRSFSTCRPIMVSMSEDVVARLDVSRFRLYNSPCRLSRPSSLP